VGAIYWLTLLSSLPRVEDPWPSSIGMDLPFTTVGIGGVIGTVVAFHLRLASRDRAVMIGGLVGFWLGALFYLIALANQVVFVL
jgi:hypothetical protein